MHAAGDLPDVNVWLALHFREHVHHAVARRYWRSDAAERVSFCRVSALGFVRLCASASVTSGRPLSLEDAWGAYRSFRRVPEVRLLAEPEDCDRILGELIENAPLGPRLLTDTYLAAFARAADLRLVTFDTDFRRFPGLDVLLLAGRRDTAKS